MLSGILNLPTMGHHYRAEKIYMSESRQIPSYPLLKIKNTSYDPVNKILKTSST